MCYHFKQSKAVEHFESKEIYGPPRTGVYNGFSYPLVSTITEETPGDLVDMKWGLIPSWAPNDTYKKFTLNARYESIHEKPSFKNSKRCLIFADGFYEWKWLDPKGRKKQKYLIEYPDSVLFGFAGLYDQWVDKETGEILESCSIVTTAAEGIMKEVHNSKRRMPITFDTNSFSDWLTYKNFEFFSGFIATPSQ